MQPGRKTPIIRAVLTLAVALICAEASAQDLKVYELKLGGKRIGTITAESKDLPRGGRKLTQNLRIKTSGFWNKIDITGSLEETISATGKLQEASSKLKENNKIYWSKLSHSGEEYLSFRAQMKNEEEKDIEELAGLATGVVTFLVPEVGDVIEIGTLLLSDGKNDPKHDRLTRDSFDTSFAGLPFYWERNGYRLPDTLRIFETEDMVILGARVEDRGTVFLPLAASRIPARQYRFNIKEADPIDVWLARAENGRAYFAQVNGRENGSAFQVVLTSGGD